MFTSSPPPRPPGSGAEAPNGAAARQNGSSETCQNHAAFWCRGPRAARPTRPHDPSVAVWRRSRSRAGSTPARRRAGCRAPLPRRSSAPSGTPPLLGRRRGAGTRPAPSATPRAPSRRSWRTPHPSRSRSGGSTGTSAVAADVGVLRVLYGRVQGTLALREATVSQSAPGARELFHGVVVVQFFVVEEVRPDEVAGFCAAVDVEPAPEASASPTMCQKTFAVVMK